jgi:hypothetical protein
LFVRILRKRFFGALVNQSLEPLHELFQIGDGQSHIGKVVLAIALVLQAFNYRFERLVVFARPFLHAHHHVAIHLKESSVGIPGKSRVVRFPRDDFDHFIVHTEIENRIHHSRHGIASARAHRHQQRSFLVAEPFAGGFFDLGHRGRDLRLKLRRIRAIVLVKITANLSGKGESRRHWQTDPRHFMEVCAFAAQQRLHRASSVSVTIPEVINVTRRARSLPRGGFARSESDWFPRALKSFSKIRFSFCGHNLQWQRPLK